MAADASWVWQSPRSSRCSSLLAHRNAHGDRSPTLATPPCGFRSACAEADEVRLLRSAKLFWQYKSQMAQSTSGVRRKVRAAPSRHGLRAAVADQHNHIRFYALPHRFLPSRYCLSDDVCITSLSEKSQHYRVPTTCVSVCVEYMQCILAKWLILSLALSFGTSLDSLALSFGTSLDRSRICADRIARFISI